MGKHSKNAGVMGSESLTYHERKALGFGTVTERLGKVRRWGWVCGMEASRMGLGPGHTFIAPPTFLSCPQDSIGNFYDCRLTLRRAQARREGLEVAAL